MEKRVKPAREGQPQPLMLQRLQRSLVLWPKRCPKYLREDKEAVSRQRKQDKSTAELLRSTCCAG